MLEEKIMQDYKQAMKEKDNLKSSVLSFLRAGLKNYSIEKRKDKLTDSEVISVIKRQVRQRQDSIEQFKKGQRSDLAEKETKELKILESYLPAQIPEGQLRKIIEETINSFPEPVSMSVMGKVMKEVMSKVGSCADGRIVSNIVKEHLAKNDKKGKIS